jgi:hypothetical protein
MQDEIGQVITARSQAVKPVIEHIGQPDKRIPQTEIRRGKSPFQALGRKSRPDMTVLKDIDGIVEIDEVEMNHLPVDTPQGRRKKDGYHQPTGFRINIHAV